MDGVRVLLLSAIPDDGLDLDQGWLVAGLGLGERFVDSLKIVVPVENLDPHERALRMSKEQDMSYAEALKQTLFSVE